MMFASLSIKEVLQSGIILVTIILCFEPTNSNLFAAQVDIDNLYILEKLVTEKLQFYLLQEENRLKDLRNLFQQSFGAKKQQLLENTQQSDLINNFLVIKRLFIDLENILRIAGTSQAHIQALNESVTELRQSHKFPTSLDLTGTIEALVRTQRTYDLEPNELANGFLAGFNCGSQLNVDDCFEVGKFTYGSNEFAESIKWFDEALKRSGYKSNLHTASSIPSNDLSILPVTNFQTISTEEILKYLKRAQSFNSTVLSAKGFLSESIGIQLDSVFDEFSKFFERVEGHPQVDESFRNVKLKYESLCRDGVYQNTARQLVSPDLSCYYTDNGLPYGILNPIKKEVLSISPEVILFHDIISDFEIKILQELSKPKFRTAEIITAYGSSQISNVRTSKSAWLENSTHPILQKLNQRIGFYTNLDLQTAEELQIVNYGTSGQYEPHYDFYYGRHSDKILDENGNRIATLLIYMSDVLAGGGTVFPSLNLSVLPQKGSALFWYNLLEDGSGDYRTRHGACPVLIGSKWVANKWIHEARQEFRRPCQIKKKHDLQRSQEF